MSDNVKIAYYEQSVLRNDKNPNGFYEEEVNTFLRGDCEICCWESDTSQYGYNRNCLYPAFDSDGKKSWLHEWYWHPYPGYCADGGGSQILSFERGVELLLKLNAFEWIFK